MQKKTIMPSFPRAVLSKRSRRDAGVCKSRTRNKDQHQSVADWQKGEAGGNYSSFLKILAIGKLSKNLHFVTKFLSKSARPEPKNLDFR